MFLSEMHLSNNMGTKKSVLNTVQINFHAVDVNKYRYIQTPIGLLIFEFIGHVYAVQCEVLRGIYIENLIFYLYFMDYHLTF